MKKLFLIIFITISSVTLAQHYPHISELRGLEDSLNNTHLFYRYVYPFTHCWSKNIYHYDLSSNIDTFYIPDNGYEVLPGWGCEGIFVNDYEFFNNDPAKFIYGGYDLWIDPVPIIIRYDGEVQIPAIGGITEIEISEQNDTLVYAALESGLFKSTDGGYNFVHLDSIQPVRVSMVSLNNNDDSQIFGIDDNKLIRTEDEGYSYIIVDNDNWRDNSELSYDSDGNHIYGVSTSYNYQTHSYHSKIYKSSENGNPFTWNTILEYPAKIWFTLDDIQPGEIYYSAGKQIFKSTNFGTNFSLYKELAFKITGLYKKSGTNILYASTPLRIYEITPDSIQVIKSLPIPDEVLNYYPLAVGNKWVYDKYTYGEENSYHHIFIREVTRDSLLLNGKQYCLVEEYQYSYPYMDYFFERIDSSTGLIYRYYEDPSLPENEYLIEDLLAEVGDTIWSSREFYDPDFPTIVMERKIFNKWGMTKPRIVYQHQRYGLYTHSLTLDIGLDSIFKYLDFGETWTVLKGCIINGIVYGDTTVVSVEDETENLPIEFSLSQNYPNPFNPTTTIRFTIPQDVRGEMRDVSLKVFDVLGNEIATLVNEEKPAGSYEVEFDGSDLPSGVYFYQLTAGSYIQTKKMVLLK